MHAITLISFLFFTGLVAFITWRVTRNDDHRSTGGYFLASRSLTFPLIAGSLLMTNLSTEQMVGLNGAAFTDGLSVMAWEIVAVIALVMLALFFLPRFLRSGIATVPQLLKIRFDDTTQLICNIIFLMAYAVILLPIILYSAAVGNRLDRRHYRLSLRPVRWLADGCSLGHAERRRPAGWWLRDCLLRPASGQ